MITFQGSAEYLSLACSDNAGFRWQKTHSIMKILENLKKGDSKTQLIVFGVLMVIAFAAIVICVHYNVIKFNPN